MAKIEWYGQRVATTTLQATQAGVNAVTQAIAKQAAGNLTRGAGVDRGKLKRNIKTVKAKRSGVKVVGKVGTTKRAWYGKFLESGTTRHTIKPKKKSLLAWRSAAVGYEWKSASGQVLGQFGRGRTPRGGVTAKSLYLTKKGRITKQKSRAAMVYARSVEHPGSRATHFFSKAVDTVWPQAARIAAGAAKPRMK